MLQCLLNILKFNLLIRSGKDCLLETLFKLNKPVAFFIFLMARKHCQFVLMIIAQSAQTHTVKSYDLQMTHYAPGLHALFQSPTVKEVLKDQDSRKCLIAAICAGTVCENQLHS